VEGSTDANGAVMVLGSATLQAGIVALMTTAILAPGAAAGWAFGNTYVCAIQACSDVMSGLIDATKTFFVETLGAIFWARFANPLLVDFSPHGSLGAVGDAGILVEPVSYLAFGAHSIGTHFAINRALFACFPVSLPTCWARGNTIAFVENSAVDAGSTFRRGRSKAPLAGFMAGFAFKVFEFLDL